MARTQPWIWAVVAMTIGALGAAAIAAPVGSTQPDAGLVWLVFIGSSVHIASTDGLFSFREVREHAATHPARYLVAPGVLVIGAATASATLSPHRVAIALLAYFAWQFVHYQKQNLGLVALAATSLQIPGLTRRERRLLMTSGWSGVAALMLNPGPLQLGITIGAPHVVRQLISGGFAAIVSLAILTLLQRPLPTRPHAFSAIYLVAICFPLPIFVFTSPYAAVGGMTIAHGLQYLLLVTMVVKGSDDQRFPTARLTAFGVATLMVGAVLNRTSHLHTGNRLDHLVFGAYLGVVMTHFVVDGGLWRMRDTFPRAFLTARLPTILGAPRRSASDVSRSGLWCRHGETGQRDDGVRDDRSARQLRAVRRTGDADPVEPR